SPANLAGATAYCQSEPSSTTTRWPGDSQYGGWASAVVQPPVVLSNRDSIASNPDGGGGGGGACVQAANATSANTTASGGTSGRCAASWALAVPRPALTSPLRWHRAAVVALAASGASSSFMASGAPGMSPPLEDTLARPPLRPRHARARRRRSARYARGGTGTIIGRHGAQGSSP